jgi:hypothetical protein
LAAAAAADDDDEEEKENPYHDPNYPELEFIDYSDSKFKVDQGVADAFLTRAVRKNRLRP